MKKVDIERRRKQFSRHSKKKKKSQEMKIKLVEKWCFIIQEPH